VAPTQVQRDPARPWAPVLGLLLLPVAFFVLPALAGHVIAPGDDLTQNLPLRILSGQDLRAGRLPLWDPYIWSGAPLLGGFNAGALFPLTLLFAFLPLGLAWSFSQAATYGLCALGLYLFLRRNALSSLVAFLAASAFTWSGFMLAQLAHIGLVQGMAGVGWVLLGLDHLSRPRRSGSGPVLVWGGALGLVGGLVCLAGDPRAISNVAVVALAYGAWALWARPRARRRLLSGILLAVVLAGAVSAAQLLPGLAVQASSQRAGASLAAFDAGSLSGPLLLLSALPFFLGGPDSLGLPSYSGGYNLAEVSSYVGLLTLAGAFLAAAGAWSRRRRQRAPEAEGMAVLPWVGLAAVGLLLSLGQHTPLDRLLVHVPLYGGQRLQSRNLGEVDLALVVLFAIWAEAFVQGRWQPSRGVRRVGLLVPLAVAVCVLVAWAWPGGMAHFLGRGHGPDTGGGNILPTDWPYALYSLGVAVPVAAVIVGGDRLPLRTRGAALVVVTVIDIGFYAASFSTGWESVSYLSQHQVPPEVAAVLPANSRYLVYDPSLYYPAYARGGSRQVPVPDLNVLDRLPSIQGYGSVVADSYEQATGTHLQGSVNPAVLSGHLADRLDLGLVLVLPQDIGVNPALAPALDGPRWQWVGVIDGLLAWRNRDALAGAGWMSAGPSPSGSSSSGSAHCSTPEAANGRATCTLTTTAAARLERSEAWSQGWKATLHRAGSTTSSTVAVLADDQIQAVDIPRAGSWTVTFRYKPGLDYEGIYIAMAGTAAAVGAMAVGWSLDRRRQGAQKGLEP
jgi:hypothetical protein